MSRPPRVLAFVGAHPDDDVMGLAGIIALHRDDPDLRFVLVTATDGEGGEIAPGSDATRATLGAVRRRESVASWDVVGRQPDRMLWFGLPDGGLSALRPGDLEDRVAAVLGEERPDVVVTFGADGITGHPDHVAVGAATDAAFARCAEEPGPGLRRVLHGAFPRSVFERINDARRAGGQEPYDADAVFQPHWVPDEDIACSVDQSAVWSSMRDAMRAHRSQWAPPWSQMTDRHWQAEASMRHFVQAWPPRPAGAPRYGDLFDGL